MSSTIGPNVAGSWYPGDPASLRSLVKELMDTAHVSEGANGDILGLVEPHAGYVYSGKVAAAGFRLVRGRRYERVLLIGPSHYAGFHGATLPEAGSISTPLGEVAIDRRAIDSLRTSDVFRFDDGPFRREHSLEAEIPFLQEALQPGWQVVPVLLGFDVTGPTADGIRAALAPLVAGSTLIVASSDFTHFGAGFGYAPFKDSIPDRLRELDLGSVAYVEKMDADGFDAYVRETGATICGRHAIGLMMRLLPRETTVSLVDYDTSGRMTNDWSHTVSYATVAFTSGEEGSA